MAYWWSARHLIVLLAGAEGEPVVVSTDEDIRFAFAVAEGWILVCETSVRLVASGQEASRLEFGEVLLAARWQGSQLIVGDANGHDIKSSPTDDWLPEPDELLELYLAKWGAPSRNARFEVDGLEIEIFKWNADANPEGVNLYATMGASARVMADRDPDHRVEFFVGLMPAKDDVASPLAALALYPTRERVTLDHGHTVPAEGLLWAGTDMRRFLVVRPVGDIIPPLELSDGLHVEFLQAIPIFDSELAYKT